MSSPIERRQARTRQEIITTAHHMIVQHGLENLSLRALAQQIDYSPAALYRYFGSKDELIDVVREYCFEKLNAYILSQILQAETASAQLLEGGLAYIRYAAEHPADYHLMFHMEPSDTTRPDNRERTMQALLQITQYGIERGEFTITEQYTHRAITIHCWATVHGLAMLQSTILQDGAQDLDAINRQILQQVIQGFSA